MGPKLQATFHTPAYYSTFVYLGQ